MMIPDRLARDFQIGGNCGSNFSEVMRQRRMNPRHAKVLLQEDERSVGEEHRAPAADDTPQEFVG